LYNSIIGSSKKIFFETGLKANQANLKESWQILKKAANLVSFKSDSVPCFVVNDATYIDLSFMAYYLMIFFFSSLSTLVGKGGELPPPPSATLVSLATLPPPSSSPIFLEGAVRAGREWVVTAAPLVGAGSNITPAT
jgi:hypothetical protein